MDEKLIIGMVAAIAGGILTLVGSYLTAKYRLRELEIQHLRRLSDRMLAAAHEKLNDAYLPIISKVEAMQTSWMNYLRSRTDQDKQEFLQAFELLGQLSHHRYEI